MEEQTNAGESTFAVRYFTQVQIIGCPGIERATEPSSIHEYKVQRGYIHLRRFGALKPMFTSTPSQDEGELVVD